MCGFTNHVDNHKNMCAICEGHPFFGGGCFLLRETNEENHHLWGGGGIFR